MSSNSYEKQLTFGDFKGICQAGSGHNLSLSYAHDGYGFITYKGEIMSMNPLVPFFNPTSNTNMVLANGASAYSGGSALSTLYKRFRLKDGAMVQSSAEYMVFVDADGRVWYKQFEFDDDEDIEVPSGGWTCANTNAPLISSGYLTNKPCCVAYEINYAPPETLTDAIVTAIEGGAEYYYFELPAYEYRRLRVENGKAVYDNKDGEAKELSEGDSVRKAFDAPVDCLFIAHQEFGLACLYAPLDSDSLTLVKVHVQPTNTDNEIKFGAIELYNDRLWGTMIETDPDKLMYSAPKDPFNWDEFSASPADGAGDIQQPNFNGDEFVMLKRFGTSLLAIKSNGIWRVTGTNPSNFSFAQQYGEQELIPNTAVVFGSNMYVMGNDDILRYNGYEVAPVSEGFIANITSAYGGYSEYEGNHMDDFAVMDRHIYCIYLKHLTYQLNITDNSVCGVLVEYNTMTGEINVRQTSSVDLRTSDTGTTMLLCGTCDETNALFMNADGQLVTRRRMDETAALTALPFYYESGYQNLSASNVIKGGFDIYLRMERSRAESEAVINEEMTVDGVTYTTADTVKDKEYVKIAGNSATFHPYEPNSTSSIGWKNQGKEYLVLVRGGGWLKIQVGNSTPTYCVLESEMEISRTDGLLNPPLTTQMTVGIRTEKKLKIKTVTLTNGKPRRVHINNTGRYFRLELSTPAQTSPWRILGNVTVNLELDYD